VLAKITQPNCTHASHMSTIKVMRHLVDANKLRWPQCNLDFLRKHRSRRRKVLEVSFMCDISGILWVGFSYSDDPEITIKDHIQPNLEVI
jgi:hypothetical protein